MQLLDEGIAKYPAFPKLYMMAGQACVETAGTGAVHDPVRARDYYQKGLKECPKCVPLWLLVIRLEVRHATPFLSVIRLLSFAPHPFFTRHCNRPLWTNLHLSHPSPHTPAPCPLTLVPPR
jgi:hypothetical protein